MSQSVIPKNSQCIDLSRSQQKYRLNVEPWTLKITARAKNMCGQLKVSVFHHLDQDQFMLLKSTVAYVNRYFSEASLRLHSFVVCVCSTSLSAPLGPHLPHPLYGYPRLILLFCGLSHCSADGSFACFWNCSFRQIRLAGTLRTMVLWRTMEQQLNVMIIFVLHKS